jgi:type IV secretion system protein VirB1
MDFAAMAELCAPGIGTETLRRIASVESSFNPYAIGVVGGRLERQPKNAPEALATVSMLESQGYDYSLGVIQVNQKNFARYGLTPEQAFDPCSNLRVGGLIFKDCLKRAGGTDHSLGDALSCYYSGNFTTGYRLGYVARVLNAGRGNGPVPVARPIPLTAKTSHPQRPSTRKLRPKKAEPLFVSATRPLGESHGPENAKSYQAHKDDTALLF